MPGPAPDRTGRIAGMGRILFRGVAGLLLFLAVAEIATRFWLVHLASEQSAQFFASLAQYEKRQAGNHKFSWQTAFGIYPNPEYRAGANHHSPSGFRGNGFSPELGEDTFRIACMGGSTTYDVAIADWREAWPAQLERVLRARGYRVEVINAGTPSWTSREHLLSYPTRVSHARPGLTIFYLGFNDLVFRAVWPADKLRTDYTSPERFVPAYAKTPWYHSLSIVRIPLILLQRIPPPALIDPFWSDALGSEGARNMMATIPGYLPLGPPTLAPGTTLKNVFEGSSPDIFAHNVQKLVQLVHADGGEALLVGFALDWEWLAVNATDGGAARVYAR